MALSPQADFDILSLFENDEEEDILALFEDEEEEDRFDPLEEIAAFREEFGGENFLQVFDREAVKNEATRGGLQSVSSFHTLAALGGVDTFDEIALLNGLTRSIPVSPELAQFQQSQGFAETVGNFAAHPIAVSSQLVAQSAAGSLPTIAVTGGAGAAAGSPAGPVGVAVGAAVGVGLGSLALEGTAKIIDFLASEEGGLVDVTNAEALRAAFADPELMAEAKLRALQKGLPIAAFDALSLGVAGRIFSKPARTILKKALQGAGEVAVQGIFDATGELSGQILSGEDISVPGIAAEVIGGTATTAIEVPAGVALQRARERAVEPAEAPIAAEPAPEVAEEAEVAVTEPEEALAPTEEAEIEVTGPVLEPKAPEPSVEEQLRPGEEVVSEDLASVTVRDEAGELRKIRKPPAEIAPAEKLGPVSPELREAAEAELKEGETIIGSSQSAFLVRKEGEKVRQIPFAALREKIPDVPERLSRPSQAEQGLVVPKPTPRIESMNRTQLVAEARKQNVDPSQSDDILRVQLKPQEKIVVKTPEQITEPTQSESATLGETNPTPDPIVVPAPANQKGGEQTRDVLTKFINSNAKTLYDKTAGKLVRRIGQGLSAKQKSQLRTTFLHSFTQDPQIQALHESFELEARENAEWRDTVQRTIEQEIPNDSGRIALDRILRGAPEDFINVKGKDREVFSPIVAEVREKAHQLTAERESLGLPIREEWTEADRSWYPNVWAKWQGRSVVGSFFATQRRGVGFSGPEKGSLKRRLTDRWVVVDKQGRVKEVFNNQEDADAFMGDRGRFGVKYTARDEGGKVRTLVEWFETVKERNGFLNSLDEEQGAIRLDDDMKLKQTLDRPELRLLPPMTFDQQLAHGLVEDVLLNVSKFRTGQDVVRKTRFLTRMADYFFQNDSGNEYWMDTETFNREQPDNFVEVKALSLGLPKDIKNPSLQKFMDGFVRQDLGDNMKALYSRRNLFQQIFGDTAGNIVGAAETSLRKWVTYRNPFRHLKQFPENEVMLYFADTRAALDIPNRIEASRLFWRWVKSSKSKAANAKLLGSKNAEFMKEFVKGGIPQIEILEAAEMGIIRDYATRLETVENGEEMGAWETLLKNSKLLNAAKRADNAAFTTYNLEDTFYKYQYYHVLRKRGVNSQEALRRVRAYTFDWSNAPPFVKKLRFIPFTPAVTWQFSRILGNKLRDESGPTLIKIALMTGAFAAAQDLTDWLADVKPEERKKGPRGFAKFGPSDIVLPVTDSKGRNLRFRSEWLIPYSDLARLLPENSREKRATFRSFMPMVAQPILTYILEENRFGTRLTFDTTKDPEKIQEQKKRIWLETLSAALPGISGTYWWQQWKNATRDEERLQQDWMINALAKPLGVSAGIEPRNGTTRARRPRRARRTRE